MEESGDTFVAEPIVDDDVADTECGGEVVGVGGWEGVGALGVFE